MALLIRRTAGNDYIVVIPLFLAMLEMLSFGVLAPGAPGAEDAWFGALPNTYDFVRVRVVGSVRCRLPVYKAVAMCER